MDHVLRTEELSELHRGQTSAVVCCLQMQVDEYKQLKESLNAASNLGQHQPDAAPAAPESHNPEAQRATDVDLPHKDEPGHHLEQQDTESRVT